MLPYPIEVPRSGTRRCRKTRACVGTMFLALLVGCEQGGSVEIATESRTDGVRCGLPDTVVVERDLVVGSDPRQAWFGLVSDIEPHTRGRMLVVDAIGPRVMMLGRYGTVVTVFGRRGQGPGEYEDVSGIAVLPSGDVLVRDPRRAVMRFTPEGDLVEEWRLAVDWLGDDPLSVDSQGRVALKFVPQDGEQPSEDRVGFLLLDWNDKTIDTVPAPQKFLDRRFPRGMNYLPRTFTVWHPQGHSVIGASDTYEIVFRPGGARESAVQHPFEPVRLSPEEREWWIALFRSRLGDARVDFPRLKPAFRRMLVSRTGDLLVHRHTDSELSAGETGEMPADGLRATRTAPWTESLQIDVWSPTGCLREVVLGPSGVSPLAASNDTIWASENDEAGRPTIVRYLR